ncbi:hypothetical protein DYBT9275_01476 [Dyadobacter sp. CECT 9275]|uniref:DUF4468 domain-containing protein n=1 Tax=Dyadobacter helix TaxID=2822344 RepID=A0A916JAA9_9BACT|nr:hypothetical protein [Dyadobacter sp. CECT 9275]CAG4994827.1 hypothetical protein DYBT9275_01476 [Dyadobacter sp. CECT 9275]
MKNGLLLASVIAFSVLGADLAQAQRVELRSGDVTVLSGEKTVNVEYDYSNFGVGKFATEQEYLDKKTAEYNAKEAGKGDAWRKAWVADRKERFEPKFEELFNKGLQSKGLTLVQGRPDAKYTFIVRIRFVEPGFNVGVMRKNAYIDFEIDLVESGNKSAKVAEMFLNNVPGGQFGGFDFDTGVRLAESYAKGGKVLAGFLDKKLK